jgi:hypothetical protein
MLLSLKQHFNSLGQLNKAFGEKEEVLKQTLSIKYLLLAVLWLSSLQL